MLKKLFKLMTVFSLLLGGYLGYVRVFAIVVHTLTSARKVDDTGFIRRDSRSKQEAMVRAREAFGPNHWTADEDLQLRYYNSERGFWMYSQKDERIIEEDGVHYDGKRIKLRPAAIIWRARDGSSTKTVTAEEAIIDFNQSLSFNVKPDSEPMVVKFARLERNVMIRDDRGTPGDPSDDMVIGPLTWVEYDDNKLQIRSESDIQIVDRDTRITGDGGPDGGMLIVLRPKSQPVAPGPRTAGFEGAQSARLLKNPHIVFSDVGKTGILPGSVDAKRVEPGKLEVKVPVDQKSPDKSRTATGTAPSEPVPLDVRCEGPMQVDLPKPQMPVKVGPPAPPAPTLVHFTRNVVVRRGKLTELPDQLDTDNLDLTLVQAEKGGEPRPAQAATREGSAATPPPSGSTQGNTAQTPGAGTEQGEPKGLFGGLTLQRVKATGHAVWLQLPAQGAKIRCNELLHKVAPTGGQNMTYFRGDATRKLMVEKYDYVEERPDGPTGPVKRTPQSITRVWTIDATLVDSGAGMDASNLFAHGPGLLETRPVPGRTQSPVKDVPPDRTVVWQDLLVVKNILGPDNKTIAQRELILKGQPRVVDRLQQSSLDAVDTIVVWLAPRPADPRGTAAPVSGAPAASSSAAGGFQIKRLLALGNAHLVAPSRNLTARQRLEADFEELSQAVSTSRSTAPAQGQTIAASSPAPAAPDQASKTTQTDALPKPPAEPNMVALADRVEAKVLIDPTSRTDTATMTPITAKGASDRAVRPAPVLASATKQAAAPGGAEPGASYEIRDVRMFGAVTLHQDPSPGKTKGQDARGEALILRNEGPGQAVFNLYHQDPRITIAATAGKPAAAPSSVSAPATASPRPLATVITEDMTIEGQVIGVNQKTDQAWAYGPGKLVQFTERALLTDRSDENANVRAGRPGEGEAGAANRPKDAPKDAKAVKPRPRTRAGKIQGDRVPLVITWGEKMLFQGRSVDPDNRPAAKAQFFKNVQAEMEDGLLYCDQVMTTYTDQPIPLADLGKLKQPAGKPAGKTDAEGAETDQEPEKPKPDLTLIDLVGKARAISRKVDPDRPVLLSRQKITGDRLIYDRRTGDFHVPGAGVVYLHDRGDNAALKGPDGEQPVANRRTVRPATDNPANRPGARKAVPPLVLTQIKFTREMKGRFGTGKATDQAETRWAEFFGDIEAARAIVPDERTIIDYDRPPPNTYFLTSQTMRVVTEPPPPGSARNTPERKFLKAWENAYARTVDTMIQADVITYDSLNDLIYANGLEGRQVQVVQQVGTGQAGSPMRAEAVRVNPKTGAADVIGPQVVQMLDRKTGVRPTPVPAPDPNAKAPKPVKPQFRVPQSNGERRGFTGR